MHFSAANMAEHGLSKPGSLHLSSGIHARAGVCSTSLPRSGIIMLNGHDMLRRLAAGCKF